MPDRFSEVSNSLLRGGEPSESDLVMLKDIFGVRRILSLDGKVGAKISPICKRLGLKHAVVALGWGNDPKVAKVKQIIPQLVNGPKTYVHCLHGKDRTGMVIAMCRIGQGWPLQKALVEAHHFGMGLGLDSKGRNTYYDAVRLFDKEHRSGDIGSVDDIVDLGRDQQIGADLNPGIGDSTLPRSMEHGYTPLESPDRAIIFASAKVYRRCPEEDLLLPRKLWYQDKKKAQGQGPLWSAFILSTSDVGKLTTQKINQKLIIENADKDVVEFGDGIFLVYRPSEGLEGIYRVSEDSNEIQVGTREEVGTSALTSTFNPGSGYGTDIGGAAGFVSSPIQF